MTTEQEKLSDFGEASLFQMLGYFDIARSKFMFALAQLSVKNNSKAKFSANKNVTIESHLVLLEFMVTLSADIAESVDDGGKILTALRDEVKAVIERCKKEEEKCED